MGIHYLGIIFPYSPRTPSKTDVAAIFALAVSTLPTAGSLSFRYNM